MLVKLGLDTAKKGRKEKKKDSKSIRNKKERKGKKRGELVIRNFRNKDKSFVVVTLLPPLRFLVLPFSGCCFTLYT